jgi:hypothetical protein
MGTHVSSQSFKLFGGHQSPLTPTIPGKNFAWRSRVLRLLHRKLLDPHSAVLSGAYDADAREDDHFVQLAGDRFDTRGYVDNFYENESGKH